MSVRHQKRLYIEELFSHIKQNAGEYRIYNLYVPENGDIEDLEIIDLQVDFSDPESIKKYLDRTTRETLEAEVKGLRLLAMVLEKEGSYIFSSKEELSEDFKKTGVGKDRTDKGGLRCLTLPLPRALLLMVQAHGLLYSFSCFSLSSSLPSFTSCS
jgi:hypothetical protein